MNTACIAQKLWNYCNVLRDDGMSYGDYVEAAPRQLLPALPYLLHPCSRAHPGARGIRTSLFSTLTYLLFLKMADERTNAPYNQKCTVAEKYGCVSLIHV